MNGILALAMIHLMKPALRASALIGPIDGSQPFFLPLTSGIAKRPGRLFLASVSQDVWAKISAQGINPNHYELLHLVLSFGWPRLLSKQSDDFTRFPILDEILIRVRKHNDSVPRNYRPVDVYGGIRFYMLRRPQENIRAPLGDKFGDIFFHVSHEPDRDLHELIKKLLENWNGEPGAAVK